MENLKKHIKLCNLILAMLSDLRANKYDKDQRKLDDILAKWNGISNDLRLQKVATCRKWHAAAAKVKTRMIRNISDLSPHFSRFKDELSQEESKLPVVSDLIAELQQTEQELGEVTLNLEEKTISIVTDPITMEDLSLGSFEIVLQIEKIKRLCFESPYKIVALDPNPASSDENVTHPHVSNEILCEGDGHLPIRKALEQGRLCDFFTIVSQILNTYNPDSPYVPIGDWEGICCYDCGYSTPRDETYYCEECYNDFCSQCSTYCQICDTTTCFGCAYECPSCRKPVCRNCVGTCDDCETMFCTDCLNDALCSSCEENRKEDDYVETKEESRKPDVTVQPVCVGETHIHA